MTALQLLQTYAKENHLAIPGAVTWSDPAVVQLLALLNKTGRDIRDRMDWQVLKVRKTWVSPGTEDQGHITTLLGEDPDYIIPGTIWDNDTRLPVYGPTGDAGYQELKALIPQGPLYQLRVQGDHLFITGDLPAGHNMSLIFKSRRWVITNPSVSLETRQFEIESDGNTPVWDDQLMLLGLDYHYKKTKNLNFGPAGSDFEAKLADWMGRDMVKPVINMAGPGQPLVRPAILVPAGSWTV